MLRSGKASAEQLTAKVYHLVGCATMADPTRTSGSFSPVSRRCLFQDGEEDLVDQSPDRQSRAHYMSDLALRTQGASLLPDHDVAIFDEAHSLGDVAAD